MFVLQANDDAVLLDNDSKYLEELAQLKRSLDTYWQEIDDASDN